MNWLLLLLAGIFEIGWPLGFKLSQNENYKWFWIAFAVVCMSLSGYLLWLAQRSIPIGTAYAVWTGIGAVGTFLIGIIWFKDSLSLLRLLSTSCIVVGVVGLKIFN